MIGQRYAAAAAGAVVAAAASSATVGLRRWRSATAERLEAGSTLLDLPSGVVEIHDSGAQRTVVGTPSEPVILVVHGTPGGYDQAKVLAAGLQLQARRIVSVSRPGYLRTPLSSGPAPADQAALFADVLDALDVADAIVISGGGPAAIEFVLRHPDRCARLVLLEALVQTFTDAQMYASLPPGERIGKRLGERMARSDAVVWAYLLLSPATDASRPVVSSTAHFELRREGFEADMALFEDVPDYPFEQITAPTLVVHGTADTDVPFAQAETAARRIPNARLVTVEGADHLTLWRHRVVGDEIRAFTNE